MAERQLKSLLDLDPDLGQLLDAERRAEASHELRVAVHGLPAGEWDVARLSSASPDHVGLLLVEGVVAREVLVADNVSTELLGPGDVVRPWRMGEGADLLQHQVRWNVLSMGRLALLDRRLAMHMGRYPEVTASILDRVNERAQRLAVTQAISQLNRVDRRLVAFFWHLAERWGRMTSDGVAVPMTLSHRMLGQLVGARRPTVSTALGELARRGELVRRPDGSWLLPGEPVGVPQPQLERVVPIRRRLLPPEPAPAPLRPAAEPHEPAVALAPAELRADLRARLRSLREETAARVDDMNAAYARSTALAESGRALRGRAVEAQQRRERDKPLSPAG